MNYRERITLEAGKRGGKPCVRGLRITVYDVLDQLAAGLSVNEIIEDFPELEPDDIRACLQFAADRERHQRRLHDDETNCLVLG
ncbi:hypothetical protein CCR91_10510 [Thiorhodovibrio winogradskyi]|nr:DUF433 domain-containing protein [Thiorhodovibrio winogradskyi]MBK5969191.1 hypothetical protein [Thiorhodovibrio winogradskyi]